MKPQFHSKPQLHQRVREYILALLNDLSAGAQLPSEAALVKTLGVSRVTLREALSHLERDGRIIRRHGIGTFVAPAAMRLGTTLNEITSIPELIRASGYTPSMQDVQRAEREPPAGVAQLLGVCEGQTVPSIRIVFHADNHPAVLITYYLSTTLLEHQSEWRFDEFDGNMVAWVERTTGIPLHQSHARIAAASGQSEVARALGVPEGAPLLQFMTTAYLVDGRIAYHSVSYQDSGLLAVNVVRTRRHS